jgi:hypothetical protein
MHKATFNYCLDTETGDPIAALRTCQEGLKWNRKMLPEKSERVLESRCLEASLMVAIASQEGCTEEDLDALHKLDKRLRRNITSYFAEKVY